MCSHLQSNELRENIRDHHDRTRMIWSLMCNFTAIKYMHSSGLSFAAPDAGKKQTEHVRVFAEGTSLIAAVELVDTVQCTV
jgi:hypothetical protein